MNLPSVNRISNLDQADRLTTLNCSNCGAPYALNEARVVRRCSNPCGGNHVTPRLCWVCSRLWYSVQAEVARERLEFGRD